MKWNKKKKKCDDCAQEQGCSECKRYQDRAFELEVDEELQQERLTQFWEKYRWLVYGGVTAVLLTTAGIELYRSYYFKTRLLESDLFENATILAHDGKIEEAMVAFNKLSQSGKTGYKTLAMVNLSSLEMAKGNREQGLKILEKILKTTSKKDPIHLTTSLTYVGYRLEDGNTDELLRILDPALKNEAFEGLATELAVQLLMKKGKKEEAQFLIQKALQNPSLSAGSKSRLNTLKEN